MWVSLVLILGLCFCVGREKVVFGIWKNGSDFWDIHGAVVWHRIDGWMGAHDEVSKCQENCKGMCGVVMIFVSVSVHS